MAGSAHERAGWLDDAPLFQAWRRFATAGVAPFTIPGHKRRAGLLDADLARLLDADVPLHGGADTIGLTGGVLLEAERRAAELWGADECLFSVGGSTQANEAVCMALGRPGDTVLVARNAHRSVLSGLVLAGLRPVWLPVRTDPATGAPIELPVATVEAALAAHREVVALLCTEPSYQGYVSDLPGIVAAAHAATVPVAVDQAWAAHFGMAGDAPPHALQCGADVMVTSAHKALPAFSQASLILARSNRIDDLVRLDRTAHGRARRIGPEQTPANGRSRSPGIDLDRLRRAFDATHTTSPSAAILASIDAARAFLANQEGRAAIAGIAAHVAETRERLRDLGLLVPGPQEAPPGRFDPLKLVVHFGVAGRSGLAAEAELLARGVPVELADQDTIVAQVGLLDDASTLERLVDGIAASLVGPAGPPRAARVGSAAIPPQRLLPRDAFFADVEVVERAAAVGRIAAEVIAPYPPGVPVLVPGEEVTADTLAALDEARAAGIRIAYAADPTLATFRVVVSDSSGTLTSE